MASDGRVLELVLDHPHLLVHVVGPDGKPFDDVAPTQDDEWGRRSGDPDGRWPEKAHVIVVPAPEQAHLTAAFGRHLVGQSAGRGRYSFDIEDSRSYRAGLIGRGNAWHPVHVDVPPGSGLIEITLTAATELQHGRLAITVMDAAGSTLREGFVIRIEDTEEGAPLVVDDLRTDSSSPTCFSLPERRHRVAVDGKASSDFEHGTLMTPRAFGRFETTIEIVRDRTNAVTATLPAGARLHLKIEGKILEADRQALHDRYPTATFGGPIDWWAGRAEVWLLADGHWPEPVQFTYEMTGSSAAGTHLGGWLAIGTEQTSELLPAGRFRLEARMPGGRTVSTDVVLVEGKTTPVTLAMP